MPPRRGKYVLVRRACSAAGDWVCIHGADISGTAHLGPRSDACVLDIHLAPELPPFLSVEAIRKVMGRTSTREENADSV